MNETVTRPDDTTSQADLIWQQRVDALACGKCSEEDFMAELSSLRQSGADSAWGVIALLDQRYRRGQLPIELFRSIEAKIARRELGPLDYSTTIELDLHLAPPAAAREVAAAAAREISPADTVDILTVDYPIQIEAPAVTAAPAAPVDRVLRKRYVLEKPLGSGGTGTVFKAVDRYRCDLPQPNRIVAIKFLNETAVRPEVVSKLRREFYCAQALSHPNIVKVYELDRDGDVEFFTMEFLEGELLSTVIEKLDPIPLSRSRAWAIILEVAAGLAHAHSRGVVHGDLKPQNIMITNSGETRMLEFGASSVEIARKSHSSAMTPAYASCELLEGEGPDPSDDLFALACLSYELLAGQHPFQRRRSTVARDLGLVAPRPRGLTRQQWRTLKLGLAWRREDRSMSVGDWISKLRPASTAAQRAWPLAGGIALAALIVGVALALFYNRPLREEKNAGNAAVPATAADVPTAHGPADSAEPAAQARTGTLAAEAPAGAPHPPRNAWLGSGAAPAKALTDVLSISAADYRIGAHKNFAEIHVRRSNGSGRDATFAWWTEPGTALPDTDYLSQAKSIQLMSQRSQMASLFVKLVPNVQRKQHAVFYVVIGEPGSGAALGRVTRAAVVLPAQ